MNVTSTTQTNTDLYIQNKDKIAKALEKAKIEKEIKKAQDDSIEISKKSLQALNSTQVVSKATSPLNDLVSAGTITQDQATAIQSAFESLGKNITLSGTYTNRPKNPLDSLVSAGTITQAQETAIKGAFDSSMKPGKPHGKDPSTTALDSLVTAGTITKDQGTAILKAIEDAMKANKSNTNATNPLDSLVSSGTITQDQEDSIQNAFDSAI